MYCLYKCDPACLLDLPEKTVHDEWVELGEREENEGEDFCATANVHN